MWLNLVLTDQQLPPCPLGKFLRFFCLKERLLSDTRSIRCTSLASLPLQGSSLTGLFSPHSCLTPALFIPGCLFPGLTQQLPQVLKWIVLLFLATILASSTCPSVPFAVSVGAGGWAHFEIWSRFVLVSPWAGNHEPGGELWSYMVSHLAGPRKRDKTVHRDHLALGESPL